MFPVLPYRRRSILNSAAQPAYPSASAVPVISASACLPACLPASFTIRCLSRPGGSFHLFSALISSYFFLSHINLSEPAWAARLFVHVCMCQLSFSICLWTQRGHFRQPPPVGFVRPPALRQPHTSLQQLTLTSRFSREQLSLTYLLTGCLSVSPQFSMKHIFFDSNPKGHPFSSDRRILAFTSLTYSACPLPASSFFPSTQPLC